MNINIKTLPEDSLLIHRETGSIDSKEEWACQITPEIYQELYLKLFESPFGEKPMTYEQWEEHEWSFLKEIE